ncbi:MAG TPA: TonB-dependent receptor plug domain-containing protein, partial [Candidatus Methylomirabilis sp.]|nr:TonB-dependent receptor plug domain-containing protein [Candidatus Methylomirabilis sp.]
MRYGLSILAAVLLADPAGAQQPEETQQVDPVVVTATKVQTPASELGASITVVNGEDFQTYHYSTVGDALRNVPGLEVTQQGGYGKLTTVNIRGSNSNQVQILIDGVRVSSPTTGQVDLSDISPDQIERIEIIRGPQSTLYGADAMTGVVNIITRPGSGGPYVLSIEQQGGNYGTWLSKGSLSGAWNIFNYAFSGSHLQSGGQFENDD